VEVLAKETKGKRMRTKVGGRVVRRLRLKWMDKPGRVEDLLTAAEGLRYEDIELAGRAFSWVLGHLRNNVPGRNYTKVNYPPTPRVSPI